MTKLKRWLTGALMACVLSISPVACKHRLEPGGVYNPATTNEAGGVVEHHPNMALYLSDEAWRSSYNLALLICNLERDNRELIRSTFGLGIKHALDEVRPVIVDVNLRWAKARDAYQRSPSPEKLNALQSILAEMDRILEVVKRQQPTLIKALAKP